MTRITIIFCLICVHVCGQEININRDISGLVPVIQSLDAFSTAIPQEKVYLHFDNTSYYQGDHIWFKCYITSARHQLKSLSKTLYVELLNPGGEIVDKRVLIIENGQCHGDFLLTHLPFYSGFFEVRAYTKYMLNFGDDVIFSRLLPVFDKPKAAGNFEEKNMLGYGRYGPSGNYTMKREQPSKENAVNLRFFPEGGNLIQGIRSRVAFEATDAVGNPIDVTGVIKDASGQELAPITTLHEGRGVFTYTPGAGSVNRRRDVAEVEYAGRKYRFDLPPVLPRGVVMEVDNLSYRDSIGITVWKSADISAEMLGVAIICEGELQSYCFVWLEANRSGFKIDKTLMPAGVSNIVLFNSKGEILCDRLLFITNIYDRLAISAKTNKPAYNPFELVEMEFSIADTDMNPVNHTFSLSIRDSKDEVENNHNILTDILLMSEIKGYVRNPSYYFEEEDDKRHAALDLLLMVQGWRRYSWKQMLEVEREDTSSILLYQPEQGIETQGQILHTPFLGRQAPKQNVEVSLMLTKGGAEDEETDVFFKTFVTDSLGRFSFVADVEGRLKMLLAVSEKGIPKNYRIVLDRLFSPEPKRYRYADLQVSIAENMIETINSEAMFDDIEEEIPVDAKGIRKTWLDGYSTVSEFYSPNYSAIPISSTDYRRTLYWNPAVTPDETGKAKISFYNNNSCTNFTVSAETVTKAGLIGIYRK